MSDMPPDNATMSTLVLSAIKAYDSKRPRSIQSVEGLLGPSDLGFCANKAALTTKGIPDSDSKSTWPAMLGTAVGEWVENGMKEAFPDWIVGTVDQVRVEHTFPSGATVGGTPDLVMPSWNAVYDDKTKDGFEWVKREPWSRNHLWQVTTYVLGLIDKGILDPTRPITMGLIFWDRSGEIEQPYVVTRLFDPSVEDEIDHWIGEVIDAVKHDTEAAKEIPSPVCERICEKFTACRGQLPDSDSDLITDPDLIGAMKMYLEGQQMTKDAKRLTSQAKTMLDGVSGVGEGIQVRWTHVNGSQVPSFERQGYDKIDVREVRQS
jgi:hypothetical protein